MAPVPTLTALVETEKRRRSKTRSRTIARRRTALRASRCATTPGPALATCTACTAPIISPTNPVTWPVASRLARR